MMTTRIDTRFAALKKESRAALVTFTSGTSGRPKGVRRTHGVLAAQLDALAPILERPGSIDLVALPIFALACLANGSTCLIPETGLRRPEVPLVKVTSAASPAPRGAIRASGGQRAAADKASAPGTARPVDTLSGTRARPRETSRSAWALGAAMSARGGRASQHASMWRTPADGSKTTGTAPMRINASKTA